MSNAVAIILAAGEGTRMKSSLPKVLHPIANRPMLLHVIEACRGAGVDRIDVVIGAGAEQVRQTVGDVNFHEQSVRRGTAHAALAARSALEGGHDEVLVMFGDTPLVRTKTIHRLRKAMADGADVAVLGFQTDDPTGYGRLIVADRRLRRIVEHKDADENERAVRLCNAGLMGFRGDLALGLLEAVGCENAQNEFYLPDTVAIADAKGLNVVAETVSEEETLGVNDRAQLADRERRWQRRRRGELMAQGVTMLDPDTVYLSADTQVAADVVIEPSVWLGPGVTVGKGSVVRAFSHVTESVIGEGCEVGPFARLRPGTVLSAASKVGNFVEMKNTHVGEGAKASHLAYVGDTDLGPRSNIGAGTITANYDGYGKHRTTIGEEVFVGSNATLVAPVRIGDRANVAAGSTITRDVAADALVFGRARQTELEGRAREVRARNKARKEAAKRD